MHHAPLSIYHTQGPALQRGEACGLRTWSRNVRCRNSERSKKQRCTWSFRSPRHLDCSDNTSNCALACSVHVSPDARAKRASTARNAEVSCHFERAFRQLYSVQRQTRFSLAEFAKREHEKNKAKEAPRGVRRESLSGHCEATIPEPEGQSSAIPLRADVRPQPHVHKEPCVPCSL